MDLVGYVVGGGGVRFQSLFIFLIFPLFYLISGICNSFSPLLKMGFSLFVLFLFFYFNSFFALFTA